jgi:hypothetical protein
MGEEKTTKVEIVNDKRSGLSTAGMVLGILAIVGSWVPFLNVFSIILAIVGLGLATPALIIFLTRKKGALAKIIVALVLCVISLFIAFSMNKGASDAINDYVDKNSSEYILQNDVEVSFGEFTHDKNGWNSELIVTVKNKSSETHNFSLHIEALDADGVRIKDDWVYINNLAAGQSTQEKVFTLVSSDDYAALDKATFKVYEAHK